MKYYIEELKEKEEGEVFEKTLKSKIENVQCEFENNDLIKVSMTDLKSRYMV